MGSQEESNDAKMTDMLGSSVSSGSWGRGGRGGGREPVIASSSLSREKQQRRSNRRLPFDTPVKVPSFIATLQQEGDDYHGADAEERLLQQRRPPRPSRSRETTAPTLPLPRRKRRLGRLRSCLSNVRVKIRSGRRMNEEDPWFEIPGEPSIPPPLPANIARFVVLGDARVGKTTLVQSFLHHELIPSKDSLAWLGEVVDEGSASPSQNHIGTHWSVSYHKKDVAYWLGRGDCAGCCRVQLYDVSGWPAVAQSQTVDQLVATATTVFVAVSVEADWEELSLSVSNWVEWLGRRQQQKQQTQSSDQKPLSPPSGLRVLLVITKCDLFNPDLTAAASVVRLSQDLMALCEELGIVSCHFVSSIDGDEEWTTGEEVMIQELKEVAKTSVGAAPTRDVLLPTTHEHR